MSSESTALHAGLRCFCNQYCCAGLLGVLHTLSFAPFEWWWLQALTLGGLFWIVQSRSQTTQITSAWRLALPGFLFGIGWFGSGVSWVYISMHTYGQMPAVLAALATALFCAFLALLPAFSLFIWRRYFKSMGAGGQALSFAICWALMEWLRGCIFTGFPWISTGSAHVVGPLRGYVPIVGMYGVGCLAACLGAWSVLLVQALCARARRHYLQWGGLLGGVLVLGTGLAHYHWTEPIGQPLQVRLLQGNISQDLKFQAAHQQTSFTTYAEQTFAAPADVVIWPEVALPRFWHEIDADYLRGLQQFSQRTQTHLLVGAPLLNPDQHYTNSVLHLAPALPAEALPHIHVYTARYDKHHLVPFGEFIPFGFRWFVNWMQIPLGDFARGATQQKPFTIKDQRLALNICYEDLFGEEILRAVRRPANDAATLLVNVSNIAWFGDSLAISQHLQASRMRALETGRPMLRATNTGTTAVIQPDGSVSAALPTFTAGALAAQVQGYTGVTPYVRWGNISMLILLGVLVWMGTRKAKNH